MTDENPTAFPDEPRKSWDEIADQASRRKAREESHALETLVTKAATTGKEEFNVDKLLTYYYPNDLSDDETLIRSRAQSYRSDYYHSNAMTLEQWARDKEKIEAQGDS